MLTLADNKSQRSLKIHLKKQPALQITSTKCQGILPFAVNWQWALLIKRFLPRFQQTKFQEKSLSRLVYRKK